MTAQDLFADHADDARRIGLHLWMRLRNRIVDPDEVENAALEGLWDAIRHGWTPDRPGSRVYLRLRVRGAVLDYLREIAPRTRTAHQRGGRPPVPLEVDLLDPAPPSAEALANAEEVRHILGRLPAAWADALRLRYLEGLTLAAAGKRLGISEGGVHRRIDLALREAAS